MFATIWMPPSLDYWALSLKSDAPPFKSETPPPLHVQVRCPPLMFKSDAPLHVQVRCPYVRVRCPSCIQLGCPKNLIWMPSNLSYCSLGLNWTSSTWVRCFMFQERFHPVWVRRSHLSSMPHIMRWMAENLTQMPNLSWRLKIWIGCLQILARCL